MGGDVKLSGGGSLKGRDKILVRGICQNSGWWGGGGGFPPSPPPIRGNPVLSKACKPNNFELHNSLKLSFMNIRHLCSNFVDCECILKSNSPDILALCETNLDDSIDSGNFSVRGYLPLI